jgi:hypothetical protein
MTKQGVRNLNALGPQRARAKSPEWERGQRTAAATPQPAADAAVVASVPEAVDAGAPRAADTTVVAATADVATDPS